MLLEILFCSGKIDLIVLLYAEYHMFYKIFKLDRMQTAQNFTQELHNLTSECERKRIIHYCTHAIFYFILRLNLPIAKTFI